MAIILHYFFVLAMPFVAVLEYRRFDFRDFGLSPF